MPVGIYKHKPHRKETKEKISRILKERKIHPLAQWRNIYWLGRKHTEKTKELISIAGRGEKNPLWNSGSSNSLYPYGWNKTLKETIKKRDGHVCQWCGRETMLEVHHIDYNKKNLDPQNLITLCAKHNSGANTHSGEWEEFFNKLLYIQYV